MSTFKRSCEEEQSSSGVILSSRIECSTELKDILDPATIEVLNFIVPELNEEDPVVFVEILDNGRLHAALALPETPVDLQQGANADASVASFKLWLTTKALLAERVTPANQVGDATCWHHLSLEQMMDIVYRQWQCHPWTVAMDRAGIAPICKVLIMSGTGSGRADVFEAPKVFNE